MSRQQGPLDLTRLKGTVCVVTGAGNGGIGYGICEVAAEMGLHIAVLDMFEGVCTEASATLQRTYPSIIAIGVTCDVTKSDELVRALAVVQRSFPGQRIGALFANAGVVWKDEGLLKSNIADWQKTMEVNVLGVVRTLQVFVPAMQAHPEDSVVCTTASVGGLIRCPASLVSYCASKHAVVALTEGLSFELAVRHPQIRVCVLCPCIVRTGLVESSNVARTAQSSAAVKKINLDSKVALGPVWDGPLAMLPKQHGKQVWDRIAAGEFWMITDSLRPYVDHDFPLNGDGLVRARMIGLTQRDFERSIDNSGAPHNPLGAGVVSPMMTQQVKIMETARL